MAVFMSTTGLPAALEEARIPSYAFPEDAARAPLDAEVRFEFPLALWAERNGYGERVREGGGGAVVRRFAVRQADSFLRWLQSFAGDAIVESPRELRAAQVELARRTMSAHGESHGA